MAIIQDPQEMDIEVLQPENNESDLACENTGQDFSSTQRLPGHTDSAQETTPLLGNFNTSQQARAKVKPSQRYRCCLCSSKAALLILIWNLIVSFGLLIFLDPTVYVSFFPVDSPYISIIYAINSLILLFYPLAGCLADIRWGRHKTVINSLCFTLWTLMSIVVIGGLATISFIPVILRPDHTQIYTVIVISIFFGIPLFFGVVVIFVSLVAFSANVIQYGIDQLYDAPAVDSVLYIHWYVWTVFFGSLINRWPMGVVSNYFFLFIPFAVLVLILLGITLSVYKCKRNFFEIDSGSRNPYKLVYKVLKFAKQHTYPIRRSAFTYCEDELPSRLDFGKEKYGGPFTTEEVENVKAFVGILYLLLTMGSVFLIDVETNVATIYFCKYFG